MPILRATIPVCSGSRYFRISSCRRRPQQSGGCAAKRNRAVSVGSHRVARQADPCRLHRPIGASVRRIESDDCSTSSMISNFSDAEYLMKRLPHPRERFFEQAVFDQELSQGLLELARLSFELLDLVRGGLTRRVAGEPFLARLQELLRPTVVQVLIDPFLAAQLSNAVLAAQAFQHDADLLFSGMMPACGSANIPDCLFSALRYALTRWSHRCSSAGLR